MDDYTERKCVNSILKKISDNKRIEIEQLKTALPLKLILENDFHATINFFEAISQPDRVNLIAEIKKGSPSKGIIAEDFDPKNQAIYYREGGAAAISVLTESKFFFGAYENMKIAKENSKLPILCKDFIIDEYQIYHARHYGADAILLIVSILTPETICHFLKIAHSINLDVLVEAHNQEELDIALGSGAKIIGVNNRNLNDFSVSLETSEQLSPMIPDGIIKVAESGLFGYDDIQRLQQFGFSAFLIGEALMRTDNPVALLRSLQNR